MAIEEFPSTFEEEVVPYFPEHNDSTLEIFGKGLVKSFLNIGAGAVGTVEELAELTPWVDEENYLTGIRENIRAEEENWATTPEGAVEWTANVVAQALPYMGAALTGHAAAGALGSMAISFSVEGQEAYDNAKKRGATETEANTSRAVVGGINAVIEGVQMGRLLKVANKGKHSLTQFRKLAAQKAWGKMWKEGTDFGKDLLLNSVEEAAEEFIQQGVSLTVPYYVESTLKGGSEYFDDKEIFSYLWANKEQLGAAALGGAVVSPFLGVARAAIPAAANPGVAQIQALKDRVQDQGWSNEKKAAYIRDIDKFAEKVYGGIPDVVQTLNPENVEAQEAHATLIDRMDDVLDGVENNRAAYEAEIKETRAERFGDVENTVKGIMNDPNIDDRAKMAMVRKVMQGKMGSLFDSLIEQGWTQEEYDHFIHTTMVVHQDSATDLLKSFSAFQKLFEDGMMPEVNELKSLEPILGRAFVKKATETVTKMKSKPKTFGQKILSNTKELFNFPRAVLASLDFSAVGRQGALIAFMKPGAWAKGVGAGYRAFFSEDYADYIDLQIKTHPMYDQLKKNGVFISERGNLAASEEYFASRLAHKLPGISASERAYVTSLNTMRAHAFFNIAEKWAGTGSMSNLPELANVLNHITGRGDLGSLRKLAPALNIMFFAPKLQIARIQTLTDLVPFKDGKHIVSPTQKILAATLAEAFGTGALILWLLSQRKGVEVEHDPRSSDFGKVRIGDTRIDFWGGYSQMMRLVANLSTGEMKSTTTGEVYDLKRVDTVARYMQTKLSPVAGITLDAYRGEDFKGDLLEPSLETGAQQFYQRFTPLFIQDTSDALYYQGLTKETMATSALALHGIGAMTYPVSEAGQAAQLKNKYASEVFKGSRWSDLGPLSQKILRLHYPLIGESERRSRSERTGKKAKARVQNEMRKSERTLMRSLEPDVKNELDRLLVPVGGLGRRLSEDWYLNDQKYKQYQFEVSAALNKVLPRFTSMDLDANVKRIILENIISKIKASVRTKLVNQAKFEDLQRLR